MYMGNTVSGKGSTYDTEYLYMGNINVDDIKPGVNENPFTLYVAKQSNIVNQGARRPDNFIKYSNIHLPFRYPMVVTADISFSDTSLFPGAISACNSDFGGSMDASDTPNKGYSNELTMDNPGYNILFPPNLSTSAAGEIVFPALYSKPYQSVAGYTTIAYYGIIPRTEVPQFITYPTTAQLHSMEDGELYIAYNQKTKLIGNYKNLTLTSLNYYTINNIHRNGFTDANDITIHSAYNSDLVFTWETPAIAHYTYNGSTFTLNNVGYPLGNYSQKIDSTVGSDYAWNTRVIPYQSVSASDGTAYILPSKNRCFMDSLLDRDNDRIVTACVYETANNASYDASTWPATFGLYISYFDISSSLTFVPDETATTALSNLTSYGIIHNVHKVSITKWDHYYIIAVSTDWSPPTSATNPVIMNTILIKVNSLEDLNSSVIEPMDTILNAGFSEVLSHVGDCP